MTRTRFFTFLAGAAVVPLTALAVAASASTTPTTLPNTTTARSATVQVANSRLGRILVDSHGHTLYLFKKDSGKKSTCFGMCATFWPPLRASGKPTVGRGAHASLVGTTRRSDGKPQVTYHGHPLYRFAKDKKRGDTNGEGLTAFGAQWFAVSAAGNQVSGKSSKTGSGTPTPGY
jgi:predicted lipoprotein with Yx(FWY)xxD motif